MALEQVAFSESDAAHVFHGAPVVLGHINLVVLSEGIGLPEELLVEFNTALSYFELLVCAFAGPVHEGGAGVDAHGRRRAFLFDELVRPSDYGVQIRRNLVALVEGKDCRFCNLHLLLLASELSDRLL